MNILKKLTEIFKRNIMFYIKIDRPDEANKNNKIEEIYFKGAWEEDGEARWVFFKTEDEHATVRLKEEPSEDTYATVIQKEEPSEDTYASVIQKEKPPEDTYASVRLKEEPPVISSFKTLHFKKTIEHRKEEDSEKEVKLLQSPVRQEKEGVVSITKLGYNMTCRYGSTVIPEDSNPPVNDLIDQRDIIRDEKIKVFFAEDNKSFQLVLRTLIKYSQDKELIGWASDGEEAIEKIKNLSPFPDVILMDIAMPRMDGITATKELIKINPYARIIMLTAFGDKEHVVDAFESGACGFLRKDAQLPIVEEAIKQAARGGRPVHKEISNYVKEVKKTFKLQTDYIEISSGSKTISHRDDCKKISSDTKLPSCEEKILKKIEKVEKVIQKVGRQKQILDEIIEKIEEKEKNLDELPEDNQKIDRDRQEKDYLKPLNKDVHETVHDNEITQKILYYKSLLRDRPEKINEIITASRELQEKYPENMDICISLGIAYFKKNLFKEGLVEFAKTLYNKDFFNKKSIQKMINYDIISQKPASLLPDASAGEYDLTDELWEKIKPLIPEKKKKSGRPPMDDRKAMDAIFYVFHKECPWKAIPESLGAGSTVHNRFQKWRHAGVFEALCNNGIMDCNVKKVMSDYCKRRNICF